jgi:sec-independent protein translocase protein TatA
MGLDNPLHILILLVVVLLVFGAKRLPEIGRSLGDGMRGFKDSLQGDSHPAGLDQAAAMSARIPETVVAPYAPVHNDAARPVS